MSTRNESLANAIIRVIRFHTNLRFKDNMIEYEIFVDYRDELDNSTLKKIFTEHDKPRDAFYKDVVASYEHSYFEIVQEIIKTIKVQWKSRKYPYSKYKKEIEDWIYDHINIVYPFQHYLNQKVCVDIIVDTGDANYDFTSNCVYPHYNGDFNAGVPNEASILWLAKQQGYKKPQLKRALKYPDSTESVLLKSIRREVLNCSTHMNALVFLAEMTLEELFELNEKELALKSKGSIILKKDSVCGLYDAWSGAGSLLDIELEKDVILPIRYIHSVTPDCLMQQCSVAEVYGVSSDLWAPTIVLNPKKEVA